MVPTLLSENDTRPRFEYYPSNSPTLRTVYVQNVPFTIGRGDEVELQIQSPSVSRKHAQLVKNGSGFRLCDLDSTNGTAVNGQSISDCLLQDGDSVSVADVDLTFVCSSMGRLQRIVTQPLAPKSPKAARGEINDELTAARTLSEVLLWQAIPLRHTRIVDVGTGAEPATLVSIDEPLGSLLRSAGAHHTNSTATRLQRLAWQIAAEEASGTPGEDCLLVRIELAGLLDEQLAGWLDEAAAALSKQARVGVFFPWEWIASSPTALKQCAELRSRGAVLAINHFDGGARCIDDLEHCPPEYLVLDRTLVRGVANHPRRLQQLEIVEANCDSAGIRAVLPPGLQEADYQTCHDCGLNLLVRESTARATPEEMMAAASPA